MKARSFDRPPVPRTATYAPLTVGSSAEPAVGDDTLLNAGAFRVVALNENRRRDGSAGGVVRSFSDSFFAGIIVACPGSVLVLVVLDVEVDVVVGPPGTLSGSAGSLPASSSSRSRAPSSSRSTPTRVPDPGGTQR